MGHLGAGIGFVSTIEKKPSAGDAGPSTKRKRSSVAEFGRKVGRKVSGFLKKGRRSRGDSGYQSLIPASTPEMASNPPQQPQQEDIGGHAHPAQDAMSITTVDDAEFGSTPLLQRCTGTISSQMLEMGSSVPSQLCSGEASAKNKFPASLDYGGPFNDPGDAEYRPWVSANFNRPAEMRPNYAHEAWVRIMMAGSLS